MSDEITAKSLTYVETDLDVYRVTVFENDQVNSGTFPLNWSALGGQNFGVTPVASTVMPSGKAMEITKGAGDRLTLTWNAPPAIRDVSAVALFRSISTPVNMGIGLRMSGASGAENCYFCRFSGNTNIEIFKIVAATATQLAVPAFAHVAGENLWMRFDALDVTGGVLLRAKVWRGEVDDEPESFLASFTETTDILAAAPHGLLVTGTNTPDFLCGLFRVRSMFSQATETLRFTKSASYLPVDIDAVPSLLEVQISPGAISLGENLGERSSLTAAFKDHRHADLGELFNNGSFWGKFRARELFRRGEPIRVLRGFLGDAIADMEARHYVLDSFSGPSFSGAFQLTGKDPLKLADNDRALAPAPSQGSLIANILSTDTSFSVTPGGIGATYPSSGYIAVGGKEVMAFQRGGNDAFTKVMLHTDGVDASTTFADVNAGGAAHTWTAAGNAQIDTADFKFSGASGLFDGVGDFVTTPDSVDYTLGSANFTIDAWFKCNVAGGSDRSIAGQVSAGQVASTSAWDLHRSGGAGDRIRFEWSNGAAFLNLTGTTVFTNAVNTGWHHVAVVRVGNVINLFVDGVLEDTDAISGSIPDSAAALGFGCQGGFTSTPWQGWLDEFRFSVGVARWTSNFTPPPAAYGTSVDVFNIVRAQFNTVAIDHSAQDRVQLCLLYSAKTPADIFNDLFVNYAGIPQAYIPLATWQTECDTFLDRLYTKLIADPEGVQDLASRLIQQAGLAMWWDSEVQLIKLQVLRGVSTDAFLYDQSNTLAGAIAASEQPDKRITQVWTYYGVRDPTAPLDQPNNFRSGLVSVDLEAELQNGGAVIKTIYADWIPAFGQTTAQRVNDLQIGRFVSPPRKVALSVMRGSGVLEPELGGGYRLSFWGAQTEYGSPAEIPFQVTRLTPMADQFVVEGEEMLFKQQSAADLQNRVILFDSDVNDVNLKSVHDSIYPVMTAADVIAGVTLTAIVGANVIVGSTSSATPSFNVGTGWPSGADITVEVHSLGRIAGMGGTGADGGFLSNGLDGEKGGTALFTRVAIDLNLSAGGRVWSGGGGGGSAGGFLQQGGAGGGGAGRNGGLPGLGGSDPPPGDGNAGAVQGTLDAGGVGGDIGNAGLGNGGVGGGPGLNGGVGTTASGGFFPGAGGLKGDAIDGISFVTLTLGSGSILGNQVN